MRSVHCVTRGMSTLVQEERPLRLSVGYSPCTPNFAKQGNTSDYRLTYLNVDYSPME